MGQNSQWRLMAKMRRTISKLDLENGARVVIIIPPCSNKLQFVDMAISVQNLLHPMNDNV